VTLDDVFASGKGAYMAHVYYGDPDEEFSNRLMHTLVENGVDILEFGIPFSDPTSDGPIFQRACERALQSGMTPERCLAGVRRLRDEGVTAAIVVTTYYNIIHHMGLDAFFTRLAEVGADGVIVPNVPYEESDPLMEAAARAGIRVVFLVTPLSPPDRIQEILSRASGFVYAVAVTGVTGARKDVSASTIELVQRTKAVSDIPLVVGFGVSEPGHARTIMAGGADGIITGSAICAIYEKDLTDPSSTLHDVAGFARGIRQGIDAGRMDRS